MFGALSNGEDAGLRGLKVIVDHDGPRTTALELLFAKPVGERPHTRGDDDQIGGERTAVLHPQNQAAAFFDSDLLGSGTDPDIDALLRDQSLQGPASLLVELLWHEERCGLNHGHELHAEVLEGLRGFDPQKSPANHDRPARCPGRGTNRLHILNRPIDKDARQIVSRDGGNEGFGSGRDDELVKVHRATGGGGHPARVQVQRDGGIASAKLDAMAFIPGGGQQLEHPRIPGAGEVRQVHPVIGRSGFLPENDDAVTLRRSRLPQLTAKASPHHPVAHDENRGKRCFGRRLRARHGVPTESAPQMPAPRAEVEIVMQRIRGFDESNS